nr:hypothetical protein [Kibdelosporangium sp. MJ126-NF4]CEL21665.1 hypothetical protein [Kibdelosporangium sp. MJ126-NF4]CTQ92445.1 hypothetical protein [Kibdelosporangium sp. MJ126-NF4]
MRRHFAVGLLVPVLMVGACSGGGESGGSTPPPGLGAQQKTEDEQPDQARLRVLETGAAGGNFYAYVENQEDREVAAEVEFTGYDAEGKAYKESARTKPDEKYEVFPAKSTIAVALFVVMEKKPDGTEPKFTRTDARLIPKKRSDIPAHQPGKFEAGPVGKQKMAGTHYVEETVVEVTNGYPQQVRSGVIVVMCKDASGKIQNASSTNFSAAPNEKKKVTLASAGSGSGCTAYPRMSNTTRFGEGEGEGE